MTPLMECKHLSIAYGENEAVRDLSFSLRPGEICGIVGASGSGKSTLLRAVLGLPAGNARITGGRILFRGAERPAFWGSEVACVFQSPGAVFNPIRTYGRQFREMMESRGKTFSPETAAALLPQLGLPADPALFHQCPCQMSGGMNQRMAVAAMLLLSPDLLLCDEVTSALDVVNQEQVVRLLHRLREMTGCGMLFVTHNLGVAASLADRILVLERGRIVEQGTRDQVMKHPATEVTHTMLHAVPSFAGLIFSDSRLDPSVFLRAEHVKKDYRIDRKQTVTALRDVSLELHRGEMLGVVGESGCGKSTLLRLLAGLERPDSGTISSVRCSMIFQDAGTSFDPRLSMRRSLLEPVRKSVRRDAEMHLKTLLPALGLSEKLLDRTPGQLSGGQCQRMAVLRAVLTEPDVLLCDEATSALDVLAQQEVADLLVRLKDQFPIVFVSHDPALVCRICDRILVMRDGLGLECGTPEQLLHSPQNPYTKELFTPRLEVPVHEHHQRRDEVLLEQSSGGVEDCPHP